MSDGEHMPLPLPPTPEEIKQFFDNDPLLKQLAELRWGRDSDYAGRQYEQYLRGPSITRDSGPLEKSNFKAALEMLGGEDRDGADEDNDYYGDVIVEHWTHWGPGWVEQILVHYKAKKKLEILKDIKDRIENYPVLDEEDYSQMETDERSESYDNWARTTAIQWIEAILPDEENGDFDLDDLLDENPELEKMLKKEVLDEMSYHGEKDHYIDERHFMSDFDKSDLYKRIKGIKKALKIKT